ncbi:MAG TPA: hypothetical protein PLX59_02390 [Candidatus Cloacimonadota bacterium]|nr:hypothetical protein [Candidatus Cloacimonadota bacterium]
MTLFLPELLALSIVAGVASSLCATIPDNVLDPNPEAIWGESGLLNLTVDPRLELIAVLQYLSGSKNGL